MAIANKTFAEEMKNALPAFRIINTTEDGDEYYITDNLGWCNPSAELQAIYNEELLCGNM